MHISTTDLTVTILTTVPVSHYKSDVTPGDLDLPILRSLTTSVFTHKPVCTFLEQPNTITDLAAQSKYTLKLMNYCIDFKRPAMTFIILPNVVLNCV